MNKKDKFHEDWIWLRDHPHFKEPNNKYSISYFEHGLLIEVVKVNPDTLEIDDDKTKNTKVQVWLECGGPVIDEEDGTCLFGETYHDWKLDTGADTFEQAIINLAELVKKEYGEYKNE